MAKTCNLCREDDLDTRKSAVGQKLTWTTLPALVCLVLEADIAEVSCERSVRREND